MCVAEIGLVARARGVRTHLLSRQTLDTLAEATSLDAFVRALSGPGAPVAAAGETPDVIAIERAAGRTAYRHLRTLDRWRQRVPDLLEVFAARQDHRSLRALIRGAAGGAPTEARLAGLLPTASLPQPALNELARQSTPSNVVRHLALMSHPAARRLRALVQGSQPDLLAVDVALLVDFAAGATRSTARSAVAVREFVNLTIDAGNTQNALLFAAELRDVDPVDVFVPGGRWLDAARFASAATARSREDALARLTAALAHSPLASSLPAVAGDPAHLDRAFLATTLKRLERAARLEPLGAAALLRVLLLIEAQSRDLRTLAWGAVFGVPPSLRKQHLVTPT